VIVEWADEALFDIDRLYSFLAGVDVAAATRVAIQLDSAPSKLLSHPHMGARLEGFASREVRRIIVGKYEMRYDVLGDVIYILRIWHSREDRPFTED
jgi:plasmid stabilization system protein ParE